MVTQAMEHDPARRQRVRRTLWITGTLAVAFFVLSILSMLKVG
ncbi:hypothetical protein [Frateuria terrea]|uniref:Uncharacterized protein n=1 Tax=Frateuria terrea TaxID=529704 RepID=A0A1H6X891_9GAMM|nr:hypothetical protein [Frateuria terrea]SEJ21062.1 hypothetical protein SAMN04487997_2727 [Frateuria terrea]SFP58064.1 hypothetical protein SAMN02927913_2704 [Frateuria terrea]